MSSEYDDEYEYRPQSGLSTRSSRACSLLAVPRTRTRTQRSGTRTRWLFDGYLSPCHASIHRNVGPPPALSRWSHDWQLPTLPPKTHPLGQSPNEEEGK